MDSKRRHTILLAPSAKNSSLLPRFGDVEDGHFEYVPFQLMLREYAYAGTVPVYLGAQDVSDLIPPEAYVDMRDFGSYDYEAMWGHVSAMSDAEWHRRREAGRNFLQSSAGLRYRDSMLNILDTEMAD